MTSNPRTLMELHNLDPKRGLGQNYLIDPNTLDVIVNSAELSAGDTVIEVGAGTGALTRRLAEINPDVNIIAIEIDERMVPILDREVGHLPNVRVIYDDFLEMNLSDEIGSAPYAVVANVPYYISSAIIKRVFETAPKPYRVVMTTQYELAERICAAPGDLSILAVSVQFYGQPQLVRKVPRTVFWPQPDVDSAILRIDTFPEPLFEVPNEKIFFRVVKAGFSQKRKQLKNSLSGGLQLKGAIAGGLLQEAEIDATRRAETLTLEEWAELSMIYADHIDAL